MLCMVGGNGGDEVGGLEREDSLHIVQTSIVQPAEV